MLVCKFEVIKKIHSIIFILFGMAVPIDNLYKPYLTCFVGWGIRLIITIIEIKRYIIE